LTVAAASSGHIACWSLPPSQQRIQFALQLQEQKQSIEMELGQVLRACVRACGRAGGTGRTSAPGMCVGDFGA
jgi:hypothetical protein